MDLFTNNLAYRTARTRVQAFANEGDELMARHREADECRECEAFLQLGIDAFDWLGRADTEIRSSVLRGEREYDRAIDDGLRFLYQMWLRPVVFAEKWVGVQLARGFDIENLQEFRRCCEEVRAIVGENATMSGELESMRDRAVESFRRGETVEWEQA